MVKKGYCVYCPFFQSIYWGSITSMLVIRMGIRMNQYANIIIDITHEKLDKLFQYKVPGHLSNRLAVGMQVFIPFGRGNRKITGYIIELTDKCDYDENKIKEIIDVNQTAVTVESQLIALAWWIKENYGSTMNQALKTVLPVKRKMKGIEKKTIKLNLSQQEREELLKVCVRDKRLKARKRLLEALGGSGELSMEQVAGELKISSATIKAMEQEGILKICSAGVYRNPIKTSEPENYDIILNPEQLEIAHNIEGCLDKSEPGVHYIYGVTGSGKTEIYIHIMEKVIEQGGEVILLIPEISLTFQMVQRFYQKFGERISILNSRMSAGERFDQFERVKMGEISIMIGPRSVLFTPFSNCKLIIIDEEQEGAYKSDSVPKYHAREVAIERARQNKALVVLGSATPSVEAFYKAQKGEYKLYELKKRAKNAKLPTVYTVDLREELKNGNKSIFSAKLQELLEQRLEKREQSILFLNRRGFAGFVSCRSCGQPVQCPHCDISLTLHRNERLVCHYCGYFIPMPKQCPVCTSPYIASFGIGTQKVEDMLRQKYPHARVLRMDMDTTAKKGDHERILSAFQKGEADILIGTQMIVKGHDFPNVTLVGVLAADLSLHSNDYRASERTFQLITQAAGRAGRGSRAGEVVIQTYLPENYTIQAAAKQDYDGFYGQEILYRKLMGYPPVKNMMAILITSPIQEIAAGFIQKIDGLISKLDIRSLQVLGPTSAGVAKIKDQYRMVLYCKHHNYQVLVHVKNKIEEVMKKEETYKKVSMQFDFTPLTSY